MSKTTPNDNHYGFGLPSIEPAARWLSQQGKNHRDGSYELTLKQLDKCEETRYEVTKTSTARYLLGETMSRADAITLCDNHCVTISSTPKNSENKDE